MSDGGTCKHGMTADFCAYCRPSAADDRRLDAAAQKITAIITGENTREKKRMDTESEPKKKACRKCGEVKTIERKHFEPNPNCKDGFVNICRVCRNRMNVERARAKKAAKKEQRHQAGHLQDGPPADMAMPVAPRCKEHLIIDFSDHLPVLEALRARACDEMRTPEQQAKYELRAIQRMNEKIETIPLSVFGNIRQTANLNP